MFKQVLMVAHHLQGLNTVLDCICNFTNKEMSGGTTKSFLKKLFFKVIILVSIPESVCSAKHIIIL